MTLSSELVVARTREELAVALAGQRAAGLRVALVPTMGALHDGHQALMRAAAENADLVVVSIFVNPLQFGSLDDLERYPRTWEADLEVCRGAGVAVVWAPSVDVMYPPGEPEVTVSAGLLGTVFEGASRPGHFDGVLTVVAKLFGQVRPDVAVFGAKDAQQVALVRQMVGDLELGVRIVSVDTVRANDGLALSSRNDRLTSAGRAVALAVPQALAAGRAAAPSGPDAVRTAMTSALDAEPGLVLDYLTLVDPATFAEVPPGYVGPILVLVAVVVEGTRLIDNTTVTVTDR